MVKTKRSIAKTLKDLFHNFGEESFSTDGSVLYCKKCEVKVNTDQKFLVIQHIKTIKHKNAVEKSKINQALLKNFMNKPESEASASNTHSHGPQLSKFNRDLTEGLLSADIPLSKIGNPKFKQDQSQKH